MKLGILSDTHGKISRAEYALKTLIDAGADEIVHCGDIGSEQVLELLFEQTENGVPVTAVPGNVDQWDADLMIYAKKLGIPLPMINYLNHGSINIAVCHGHDLTLMNKLYADRDIQILLTGHTHVAKEERNAQQRMINPGAVYRAKAPSVCVLELDTGTLNFIPLTFT